MKRKTKLSTSMTSTQFDNGYWYATELKDFAERIGIPSASKLRKDELEKAIKVFLRTGRIESPTRRSLSTSGVRDVERGLSLDLRVVVYTNDKETKDFLEREALRLAPGLKRKSGARYRLNRWREDQDRQWCPDHLPGFGGRIRSTESDRRTICENSPRAIHQLHERLHGCGAELYKRARDQGLENVKGAGSAEGLSIVEEVPVVESKAIVDVKSGSYASRTVVGDY